MKRYLKLRKRMLDAGAVPQDAANKLGRSYNYVCNRFNGNHPWDAADMACLGNWLKIPRASYYDYFIKPWEHEEEAFNFEEDDV